MVGLILPNGNIELFGNRLEEIPYNNPVGLVAITAEAFTPEKSRSYFFWISKA